MADPFTRSLDQIDHDLHEQVTKRDAGTNELLHGLFLIHRATLVIDRLIEERCRAMSLMGDEGQPVSALPHARLIGG